MRFLILCGIHLACMAGAYAQQKPNIVLVIVDTLRADRLSAYGYEKTTSPNIDRLLAKGARFDQARTNEPLTAPSIATLLTSKHPHEHGATRNGLPLFPDLSSITKELRTKGYHSAAFVGNWTLRNGLTGMGEHFDDYFEVLNRKRWLGLFLSEATAEDLTSRSLQWLSKRPKEQPFFLMVHYVEPHAPYRLQKTEAKRLGIDPGQPTTRSQRYDTEIAFVDRSIGTLLSEIEKRSPAEQTLIIFASDHGESLGEHSYWGHGRHLFDATLRVPLGMVWEGTIRPQVVEHPALLMDIAPTVLGLLGHNYPSDFRGFDWSPVLYGKANPPPNRQMFFQAHKGAVQRKKKSQRGRQRGLLEVGMVDAGQKEVFRVKPLFRYVYNLTVDPGENDSVVARNSMLSDPLKAWALAVERGLNQVKDAELGEQDLEMLRSLGYIVD